MTTATMLPLAAYLTGSLPVSLWVGRRWSGRDLRLVGSGNPGATNVLRVAGRAPAAMALAGDAAKGAVPVAVGQALAVGEGALAASVLGAVLGHVFSPWLRFRGGKGVATALGGFAVLAPVATAGALLVFAAFAYRYRYASLASMCAVASFPLVWLLVARFGGPAPGQVSLTVAAGIALLVVWRHRDNIRRLRRGDEARFGSPAGGDQGDVRP